MSATFSKAEINAAALAARDGGDPERAALAEIMAPFVWAMVNRNRWEEMAYEMRADFAESIAAGVWIALPKFDPEAGTKFSTFAHNYMHAEAMYWLRTNSGSSLTERQWKVRGALRVEAIEVYGKPWHELDADQLAGLEIADVDGGGTRTVSDAVHLLEAGAPDYSEEPRVATASAEDAYLGTLDHVTDALETHTAMEEALEAGAIPSAVRMLAFEYTRRHDLPDAVAIRLIKSVEREVSKRARATHKSYEGEIPEGKNVETPTQKFRRQNPDRAKELNREAQARWRARRRDLGKLTKLGQITDMEDEDQ